MAGRVVILNGAPRSGKSSIAAALQARGPWINLGVDAQMRTLPASLLPGIGLRPGGERPDLEPALPGLFFALYDAIAAHARHGFDIVADLGHHDHYSRPLGLLPQCARRLAGLEAWIVGVRCPIKTIMARRNAQPEGYLAGPGVPAPVQRWQEAVHAPGLYDLEVDTSLLTPEAAAVAILQALATPGTAIAALAARP